MCNSCRRERRSKFGNKQKFLKTHTKTTEERKPFETDVIKMSNQAYLACAFLLMTDNNYYSGVKLTLDDNYLLGKQAYPNGRKPLR